MGAECDYESANEAFYPRRFVSAGSSAWETVWTSGVKEFAAVPCTRQHAGFKAAKDAIAVAPYDAVSPVEEERWQELDE